MSDTTDDTLLDGRVQLRQPARGYRAAIDPVLLAAFIPARAGDHVLEAGLGPGAATLCLLARVPELHVTGIEIDPAIAKLARINAEANHATDRLHVVEGAIEGFKEGRYDHAMANPPFQPHGSGTMGRAPTADREAGAGALEAWIAALSRRLAARGTLSLVLPASRLSEACGACREYNLRALTVLPVTPRQDALASRILLRGIAGARGGDTLLPPLVLHEADGRYTQAAQRVLRDAQALASP